MRRLPSERSLSAGCYALAEWRKHLLASAVVGWEFPPQSTNNMCFACQSKANLVWECPLGDIRAQYERFIYFMAWSSGKFVWDESREQKRWEEYPASAEYSENLAQAEEALRRSELALAEEADCARFGEMKLEPLSRALNHLIEYIDWHTNILRIAQRGGGDGGRGDRVINRRQRSFFFVYFVQTPAVFAPQ
ncbi:hypothetical protein niasHT_012798 [Heterodera trifolii]|uniref:Uncharacterized protein n=1 Tax=Heterodera trifolii TaxID=157864 RepID=A0ABD2L9W6_9BILA